MAGLSLSESRLSRAFALADELHAPQTRKGTEIPYVSHLMAVGSLVFEAGGDEDEVVAALLHDAVEDAGGAPVLKRIQDEFGNRVAHIVKACSDTDEIPKPPWRARKEAYLEHLKDRDTTDSVLRVSLADKLHNARSILADYRAHGDSLWERFNTGSAQDQIWYYRSLARVFDERLPGPAANELDRVVSELERLLGAQQYGLQTLKWTDRSTGSSAVGRTGTPWDISRDSSGRYAITVAEWDRPDWHADTLADAKQLCDEMDRRPVFTREEAITDWIPPDY